MAHSSYRILLQRKQRETRAILSRKITKVTSMAATDEIGSLTRAFSGLGVDEKALISILGNLHPEQRQSFRKNTHDFFIEDERQFERWDDRHIVHLQHEFLRVKDAIVLWTMHPWERDARLLKKALYEEHQFVALIEIACTRSSEELLGARRAYHSLFDHSIEEDVAYRVRGFEGKLLVALLSSYRYEGPKVNDHVAKFEADTLFDAINKGQIENEEIVRILSTRSKLHVRAISMHYKEISGKFLDEDLDGNLRQAVECLCLPQKYFSKILCLSMNQEAPEIAKEALTRVIVTRADVDMREIEEEYHQEYGVDLANKIEDAANGNYRDFLLTLIARGD